MHKKKTLPNTIEDCNAQQIHILSSLRARIREAGYPESSYNDPYLLRFLCAKKFDVEKTLQMWKNFIDWRKTRNIDQVISMELPEMVQIKPYHPHMWLRTDKMGRPIYIERIGKLNLDKILKAVPAESLELYFIRDYERLLQEKFPACSKAYGETVNSTCYIMDLKGAASNIMSPKMWELLKIASKIGQEYYPETLGDMIVVNAPMWCYGAWNVIKHLLDEKTRTRVHIFGTNYKKDLLKYVDEENLPDFLGGKIPEEEYGPNMTNEQGPWVKSVVEEKAPEKEEKEEKKAKSADGANSPVENDIILGMTRSPVSELEEDEENFDELDIAQELPTKHVIKNLMARPSTEFSYVTVGHRFS